MEVDRLISNFKNDAGQKEQVALIVYYLEDFEGMAEVTATDIKRIIRSSRSPVSTSSVTTYLGRLERDSWVKSTDNGGYRLTHPGEKQVKDRLNSETLSSQRDDDDIFLNFNEYEGDSRYVRLVDDINEAYKHRIYDATMVLTRKLLEDITFQILKTHYAGESNQMFYNLDENRHYSFEDLRNNLRESVPVLRMYSQELDTELVDDLHDLKEQGNNGAHALRVDFTDEEVEELSGDATRVTEVLYEVLLGARIADQNQA